MPIEIERKYLIISDQWMSAAVKQTKMCQAYFGEPHKASIRVRVSGDQAYLNIKSATLSIMRKEYEYPIPVDEANEMIYQLCDSAIVEKTRYYVPYEHHLWEIDVFEGDNAGLVVAEVELQNTQEPVVLPVWVGDEVSDDPRYYNVSLAKCPYKHW